MGRKGSKLIPFLEKALWDEKYYNLKYENISLRVFSLILPQKSSSLKRDCQYILKDWYTLTDKDYEFNVDYTRAKQGMEAALRRSDFLMPFKLKDEKEKLSKRKSSRKIKISYRILNEDEVKENKLQKKALNHVKKDALEFIANAPSPESSGYGSGSDNASEMYEDVDDHALLHAFKHDHEYEHSTGYCPPEIVDPNTYQLSFNNFENEPPPTDEEVFNDDPITINQWRSTYSPPPTEKGEMINDDPITIDQWMSTNLPPPTEKGEMINDNPITIDQWMSTNSPPPTGEMINNPITIDQWRSTNFTADESVGSALAGRNIDEDFNEMDDVLNIWLTQDPDIEKIDFDLLDGDSMLNSDNLEFEEKMKSLNEIVEKFDVEKEVKTQSVLDAMSYKMEPIKVYEYLHHQELPEMIILTFEPKVKELCVPSANNSVEPSFPKLIFNEATIQLISSCIFEGIQVLPNDHILVFLKWKELVN